MPNVAVLTSDLQYGILQLKEERMEAVSKVLPQLSDFYNKMRSLKIPIIHLQHINDANDPVVKKLYGDRLPSAKGSDGAKILKEIFHENDITIEKYKLSGFFETDLDRTLKEMDVKTLIITGFQAQICVQTTAGDAFFRGYKVVIPNDAVVSVFEEDKKRALEWLEDYFAQVFSSEEIYMYLLEHEDFDAKTNYKNV